MMKLYMPLLGLMLLFLASCGGPEELPEEELNLSLEDAVLQQIFDIRAKRNAEGKANTAALLTYLAVDNIDHRYAAAIALASVQDSAAIDHLADALRASNEELRIAAAFALGQTEKAKAADYLAEAFQQDSSRQVLANILEAVGRAGDAKDLKDLCTSRPYALQDSLLLNGLALGLYRFALRGMVQPEGSSRMINDYLANSLMPKKARFIAANYLARVAGLDLSRYENLLINNVQEEKDPNMRMFLVLALAKAKTPAAFSALKACYEQEEDYRVRANILRGLQHFPYDSTRNLAYQALRDTSRQIQLLAAQFFRQYGLEGDAFNYVKWADERTDSIDWALRAELYGASLAKLPAYRRPSKLYISNKLAQMVKTSKNPYEQQLLLQALGRYALNHRTLGEFAFPADSHAVVPPMIKSAVAEGLVSICALPDFDLVHGVVGKDRARSELHQLLRKLVQDGDPGALAVVATAISTPSLKLKEAFPDATFLKVAQNQLQLPRDLETYMLLQRAINYIEGSKTPEQPYAKQKFPEIDWALIKALPEKPKVELTTSRGKIVIETYLKECPATVIQFIQLVKAGYYDGKAFHRVVPNFVAQTGCPRGDGWGGLNFNIVSEFSQRSYKQAGAVGMASAGKDTESAQFFITHSPAIHLDGKYTLFGQVVEGLEQVHLLELGDQIISAKLLQ
ncbi:peptidylprolyl isomerase [Saprospira sp. CCB-QB6]|uniref:peptidylprolyl isomerase n=1 Tax=Saprospira sp. CCB-QB6 TaxID=3023936 RepID=UPI00234B81A9|nr:peptidylprolyl isomerase [Saprospira sp. CCB-QB6]WCL82933.1 peptidylprolyl isomerase [Saprospira sp. CCB-QB6]